MEVPWAYHYAGRPDRTAEVVHAALTWQFGTGPGGLPGNDDSGALSSWYVWASLGLFPIAGQAMFLVSAPAFERGVLQVDGGEFVIETTGHVPAPIGADGIENTPQVQYVQAAWLNGDPLESTHISAQDVHRGGVLQVDLGPHPSDWGRVERPPSRSTVPPPSNVWAGAPTRGRSAAVPGLTSVPTTDHHSADDDSRIVIDVDGSSAGTGGTP